MQVRVSTHLSAPTPLNKDPDAQIRTRWSDKFLSLSTIWWLIAPVGIFCIAIMSPVQPNDFWWHMRTGQIILSTGYVPTIDAFSFTQAGAVWINQSWLMQIVLYLIYRLGAGPIDLSTNPVSSSGLALVLLAHSVWITSGYSLVLFSVGRNRGVRVAALATLMGATLGLLNWAVRPQSVSFLFFGLLIYLIEEHGAGRTRRLWWTIPIFALWANSHGGFIFGLGALGFYVVGQLWVFWRAGMPASEWRSKPELIAIGLLALAAPALNPQGPIGIVTYVLGFFRSDVTFQRNVEFAPLTIRHFDGGLLFGVLLFMVFCLLRTRWRLQPHQVVSLLAFLALSLWTRRGIPWLGMILIPILADGLDHLWTRQRTVPLGKIRLNGLLLGILGTFLLLVLPWWRGSLPLEPEKRSLPSYNTPQAATTFLCRRTGSGENSPRVFQYSVFASYHIWACPDIPVFADTRIELFDGRVWSDYIAIDQGRFDWENVAKRYGITHLFLDPQEQPQAVRAARTSACWANIYQDDRAMIFERRVDCP